MLVIILLFIALRSFMGLILALLPVLIAILFATGAMGILQIPSTPLTIMLATLLLGLGIDYSIHYIARYREERRMRILLYSARNVMLSLLRKAVKVC